MRFHRGTTRALGLGLLLLVAACTPTIQAGDPQPAGFPANLRYDLVSGWIQWNGTQATISWPPNDGCAAPPVAQTVAAGTLIDRFGSEGGNFFSPSGASFASRAVPYVCRQMDYRVYRVQAPLQVQSCAAAPWFGAPGGAAQVQTADPANKLVAAGTLVTVQYEAGGAALPYPQCETP